MNILMNTLMKTLVFLMALFLTSCGGGGYDVDIPPAKVLRTDLYYGYYGRLKDQVAETKAHTNLLWESQFEGEDAAVIAIAQAATTTLLDVRAQVYAGEVRSYYIRPDAEVSLRGFFTKLSNAGLLQYVKILYPVDEPDLAVARQEDVLTVNAIVRKVAKEFPVLDGVKLAVIYSSFDGFPNIHDFDIVAFDQYDSLSSLLTNGEYKKLLDAMRPGQKTMLIPGPVFGQDNLTPFFNFAQTHKEVFAVIPFVWFDQENLLGLRSLPARRSYCIAGAKIKSPGIDPIAAKTCD